MHFTKGMKVLVKSKLEFDNAMKDSNINNSNVEKKDILFISINDTEGRISEPYFENKENVLVLYFDDTTKDLEIPILGTNEIKKVVAFTKEQADEIIHFLDKNKNKKLAIIHCAAGVSRSGAVGQFVNDYFGGDYFEFKKNNPNIHPNPHVLRLLNNKVNGYE